MKRLRFIIILNIFLLLILFIFSINFLNFLKIYYIQLIILVILFFLLIFLFKFKFFLSFLLIFLISSFYFFIYPNYIQKNLINFSETFSQEEKNKITEINFDISLGSGNLKVESISNKEFLIFDYNSIYKVYKTSKIKKNVLYYEIFENPILKRRDLSNSEWNLKINENVATNLYIKTNCVEGLFDFKNLKINKADIVANSSRIEIYLPKKNGNFFLNVQLKPSIIDIYIPIGYYVEINFKLKQSITNILDTEFKEKEKDVFYFEGGDMGKIYIKISGININLMLNFVKD